MPDRNIKVPLNPDRIVDPKSIPRVEPKWRGDLPHIYRAGCSYFVTFCLADAVPGQVSRKNNLAEDLDPTEIARHCDIDPGYGDCVLCRSEVADIVESALLHFQGDRYALSAWCVMPNHVHAVVTPYSGWELSGLLHSWKSFSAHEINKYLGKTGRVWQKESFDHLVRDEQGFEKFVRYTEDNPVVAGLCGSPEDWSHSSARFLRQSE